MAFVPIRIADLDITKVKLADAEEIFALVDSCRDYLREWFPWVDATKGVEDTLAFVERSERQDQRRNGFQCCIRLDGKIVGVLGFVYVDWINRKTEIGYWIHKAYQGRGIITTATRALIDFAFTDWILNRVEIHVGESNFKSRAVAERLGFRQEGTLRETEWVNDRFIDQVVYAVLRRDWAP